MAVALLVALGIALSLGTWCEAKYGTPAAQHYFYHAAWFQILLFFLAATLVVSALSRLPWEKHHLGFITTHLGIILILIGNLLGIWFGVEGQLMIPEGESRDALTLTRDVLWVESDNPGIPSVFPVDFSTRPWVHDVHQDFSITSEGKPFAITVDRYFPNATVNEKIEAGKEEFPAIRLELSALAQEPQEAWLFARDPERFGFRWGEAHVLFFEVGTDQELLALESVEQQRKPQDKGTLRLEFPHPQLVREIPVDASLGQTFQIDGTPYTISLKDYFADFAITAEGPTSRSENPQNPALSFILKGPEGEDRFLVFALHPEFEERHGLKRSIHVQATYEMEAALPPLPPSLFGIVRSPSEWRVVMTSADGAEKKVLPLTLNETYTHPWLQASFRILESLPAAKLVQEFQLKNNDIRQQVIHAAVERDGQKQEQWLVHGAAAHFSFADHRLVLAYRPATRPLPFSVKLIDFRKKEYPGTSIASAFESDLEIADSARGLRLSKTISMNHPLTYRGYTMFQASFSEGPVETTVLSVRKDLGTPVVYAGFITVVLGLLLMFYLRTNGSGNPRRKR